MSEEQFENIMGSIGSSIEQVKVARLDLQEERNKNNELVEHCDMLAAALICLMEHHKYTKVPIELEKLQIAIEAKCLSISGDENANVIFTIENKKIQYDEFVKGVADDSTNPEAA